MPSGEKGEVRITRHAVRATSSRSKAKVTDDFYPQSLTFTRKRLKMKCLRCDNITVSEIVYGADGSFNGFKSCAFMKSMLNRYTGTLGPTYGF